MRYIIRAYASAVICIAKGIRTATEHVLHHAYQTSIRTYVSSLRERGY